eukprot:gb/GEZN01013364.1/.p1 GENE.gb/GEZN01013364.1/~~gb/GEZN01013364.1/.p1  ORF type:complete len:335 (+),score=63.63 gb/GEZN01013364.1/:99-1007(+)
MARHWTSLYRAAANNCGYDESVDPCVVRLSFKPNPRQQRLAHVPTVGGVLEWLDKLQLTYQLDWPVCGLFVDELALEHYSTIASRLFRLKWAELALRDLFLHFRECAPLSRSVRESARLRRTWQQHIKHDQQQTSKINSSLSSSSPSFSSFSGELFVLDAARSRMCYVLSALVSPMMQGMDSARAQLQQALRTAGTVPELVEAHQLFLHLFLGATRGLVVPEAVPTNDLVEQQRADGHAQYGKRTTSQTEVEVCFTAALLRIILQFHLAVRDHKLGSAVAEVQAFELLLAQARATKLDFCVT